jgi:hypothetical protein
MPMMKPFGEHLNQVPWTILQANYCGGLQLWTVVTGVYVARV